MVSITKPKFETWEAARNEFFRNGRVENVRCERCNALIEVKTVNNTAWIMNCLCGLYKDTMRGL